MVEAKGKYQGKAVALWGDKLVEGGFFLVPPDFLEYRARLGISVSGEALLMQAMCSEQADEATPLPILATCLGMKPRGVKALIAKLERGGFLKYADERFNLDGLFVALRRLRKADTERPVP